MAFQIPSGEDLRNIRKSYKLTQKELAKMAKVSQSLIARIEAGKVDPRMSTLRRIFNSMTMIKHQKTATDIMRSPVIFVESRNTVREAVAILEKYGISQVPAIEEEKIVGCVQETTLIRKILQSRNPEKIFSAKVSDVMDEPFHTITPSTPLDEILTLFTREKPAVIVIDRGRPVGIITKIDIVTSTRV